jgi:hypothetical protein
MGVPQGWSQKGSHNGGPPRGVPQGGVPQVWETGDPHGRFLRGDNRGLYQGLYPKEIRQIVSPKGSSKAGSPIRIPPIGVREGYSPKVVPQEVSTKGLLPMRVFQWGRSSVVSQRNPPSGAHGWFP